MNKQEQQKLHDFVSDLRLLSEQYGWDIEQALGYVGWKQKTNDELLVEYAQERYPQGTEFKPLDKKRNRISSGKVIEQCDRIYVWEGLKMFLVYDPTINEWADIINLNK